MKTLVLTEKSTYLPVVNGLTGTLYGTSSIPVFNKQSLDLAYLVVQQKSDGTEHASDQVQQLVCPSDILYINDAHAIAVRESDPDADWPADLPVDTYAELLGKKVYEENGVCVGRLISAELDGSTGSLLTITVHSDGKDSVFQKEKILTVGASVMLRSAEKQEVLSQDSSSEQGSVPSGDVPEILAQIQQQLSSISDYISLNKKQLQEAELTPLPEEPEYGLHLPLDTQPQSIFVQDTPEQQAGMEEDVYQSSCDGYQIKMPECDLSQSAYQAEKMPQTNPAPSPKTTDEHTSRPKNMTCPFSDSCVASELLQRLTHIEALLEASMKNSPVQPFTTATDPNKQTHEETRHEPIIEPVKQVTAPSFDNILLQHTPPVQEPNVQTVLNEPQLMEKGGCQMENDGMDIRIRLSDQPEPVFDKPETTPVSAQVAKEDRPPQKDASPAVPKPVSKKKNKGIFWRVSAGQILAMVLFVAAYVALSTFHIL